MGNTNKFEAIKQLIAKVQEDGRVVLTTDRDNAIRVRAAIYSYMRGQRILGLETPDIGSRLTPTGVEIFMKPIPTLIQQVLGQNQNQSEAA